MPSHAQFDHPLVHVHPVYRDLPDLPAVPVGIADLDGHCLAENHAREGQLGTLPVILAGLGGIDAIQANLDLLVVFEDGDGVAIRDADYLGGDRLCRGA